MANSSQRLEEILALVYEEAANDFISLYNQYATMIVTEEQERVVSRETKKLDPAFQLTLPQDKLSLLHVNDMGLKWDLNFKLKFLNQIKFMHMLIKSVRKLLETEALDKFKREEAFKKALDLDRELGQRAESERDLAFRLYFKILKDKELLAIAMILNRVKLSDLKITKLEKQIGLLQKEQRKNEKQFDDKLRNILKGSPHFQNLPPEKIDEAERNIKSDLDQIHEKFHAEEHQRRKEEKERIRNQMRQSGEYNEEKIHDVYHAQKQIIKKEMKEKRMEEKQKYMNAHLKDDVKAKEAVELHEHYRKKAKQLGSQISQLNDQIHEEKKIKAKLEESISPEQTNRYQHEIEKMQQKIDEHSALLKKELLALDDVTKIDQFIMDRNPEVFKEERLQEQKRVQAMLNLSRTLDIGTKSKDASMPTLPVEEKLIDEGVKAGKRSHAIRKELLNSRRHLNQTQPKEPEKLLNIPTERPSEAILTPKVLNPEKHRAWKRKQDELNQAGKAPEINKPKKDSSI